MKKIITIVVLMVLAMSGFAQILHYDFSAVCESGQTLYYLITSEQEQTVILTYPFSEENSWFTGDNYYDGFPEPQGEIILPTIVYYNDTPYSVTAIGDNAFNNCRDLSGILTIPEGIISIGSRAFRSCNFTSVTLPKSLEEIVSMDYGYGTGFVYCSSLESISIQDENPIFYSENNAIIRRENKTLVVGCKTTTIPDDIETIGRSAFQGSGDGSDLVIPNSVTAIDDYAFYESQFSGTITFSDSLRYIGIKAFSYCHISGPLTIPNSVTEIGNYAFSDCRNLTGNLTLSSSLSGINRGTFKYIGCTGTLIIPNSVHYINDDAFYFTNFSELVLGDSISTIGCEAFYNFYSGIHLTGVLRLPSSLTEIGREAFAYTSFDEIHSPNTTPPALDNDAFYQCDTNTPIYIPFGCTEAYQNAEGWNYFTNFIEAPAPVVPDLYTIGYKDNSSTTRTAKLYKNNTLLHSIDVYGKRVTPYKITSDSEGNIYWLIVYSENSTTEQTEIWRNDEIYVSTENHLDYRITDLFCIDDTLFYVGNTTTENDIKVATIWTGNDFTPYWVLGDGVHDSFIYDADVDKSTNIPYFCGYVTDTLQKACVWEASQLYFKQEPWGSQRSSWAEEISVDNGSIYTNGYLNYDTGMETVTIPTIWKDNEIIDYNDLDFQCLYANQGDYYYVAYFFHEPYFAVYKNHHNILQLPSNTSRVQRIYSGFDDTYMVGKYNGQGSIWKNFELLSQHSDCDVIMDIVAIESTEVDTTFTIDHTEWYYEILNDDGSITYQHLECVGDTLFDRAGKRPKIIVRSNTHYDRGETTEVTHEYVYEENGIVYWWNKDLEEFTTLYNLYANAGDEWEIKVGNESITMHVDAVENYDYGGQTYRMLHVSDSADVFNGNIVCSIGHLTSFFPERLMTRGRNYRVEGMRCYWIDGDLVFKLGDRDCDEVYEQLHHGIDEPGENGPSTGSGALIVYPNPTDGVLFVETHGHASLSNQTYRITNHMGQTLMQGHITAETQQINIESLPAGMYFITITGETRKFMVR